MTLQPNNYSNCCLNISYSMFLFACIVDIGEYDDINDDINNAINSSNIADTNEVSTNKLDEVKTHEAINEYDGICLISIYSVFLQGPIFKLVENYQTFSFTININARVYLTAEYL